MRMLYRLLLVPALLVAISAVCLADSLSEGKELYKAGNYAEAAAKLEQATKEDPKNAQAWWQLNFAYHKLNREADSLKAVQKAAEADPAHAFASSAAKFNEILADRQAKAGAAAAAPSGQTPVRPSQAPGVPLTRGSGDTTAGSGSGNITSQLMRGDVYVQPGMNVDVDRLRRVAQELRPTVVKFAVFNSRSNSRTLDVEANKIRNYLKGEINQGHGYVIASSRSAVAVSSDSINRNDLKDLTSQIAPSMEAGDYTGGLERLARGLVKERSRSEAPVSSMNGGIPTVHHGPPWGWIILGIIAAVVVIWLIAKAAANTRAMAARKGPLERQRSEVISQMNYLDDSLNMADPSQQPRIREARVAAGSKLDEASRIMAHAKSDNDLSRAQHLLDLAQADIARGRAAVEGKAPMTTSSVAGAVPPVYGSAAQTSDQTDWNAVPQNEKGVCFFCSRPSLMSELTPVTVNLDGQQQKVLACPTDLATIKSGAMPQIRAFNDNGRYVPWYAYQNYDPYRDYYSRGYGSNFLSDMIMFSAIDSMFWNWRHPVGWGWGGYGGWGGGNTYVFYGDHPYYQDYYSHHAAAGGDYTPDIDAGGTDFLSGTGGDYGGGGGGYSGGDFGSDRS